MLKNERYCLESREDCVSSVAAVRKGKNREHELNFFELFFICTVTTAIFLTLFAFLF